MPATGRCGECDLLLCDNHSSVHGLSKKTRGHVVAPLQGAKTGSDNCQLHPAERTCTFCRTCDILLCEKCIAKSDHVDHNCVGEVTFAGTVSEALQIEIDYLSGKHDLTADKDDMSAQLTAVNDDAKSLSDDISRIFDGAHETLKKQEEVLKGTLDKRRWERLAVLEKGMEVLTEKMRQRLVSKHLLTTLDGKDLIRVFSAVKTSLKAQTPTADKVPPVHPVVLGVDLDYRRGDKPEKIARATECFLRNRGPNERQHLELFDCSSYTYCDVFDPQRKSAGAVLSSQNHIVSTAPVRSTYLQNTGAPNSKSEWQTVCSAGFFNSGVVHFQLILQREDCGADQYVAAFVGVSDLDGGPSIDSIFPCFPEKRFMAWSGLTNHIEYTAGGELGQPWKTGDSIRLKLDCKESTMTAIHVPSGAGRIMAIPAQPVCLAVALPVNCSVRLVVPELLI